MLPVVAPRPVVTSAQAGVLAHVGRNPPPHAGELWNAYSSLSDGQTRQAFLARRARWWTTVARRSVRSTSCM